MRGEFLFGIIIVVLGALLENWIWFITVFIYLINFIGGPVMLYKTSLKPKDYINEKKDKTGV